VEKGVTITVYNSIQSSPPIILVDHKLKQSKHSSTIQINH